MSNGFGIFTFQPNGENDMKNFIFAMLFILGFAGYSFAGECASGVCSAPVRPVRKIVNISKEIVVAPVRVVANIAAPRTVCESVTSDCCGNTTKEVVKYQPLRRRLVNRSTTVRTGCNCQ